MICKLEIFNCSKVKLFETGLDKIKPFQSYDEALMFPKRRKNQKWQEDSSISQWLLFTNNIDCYSRITCDIKTQ